VIPNKYQEQNLEVVMAGTVSAWDTIISEIRLRLGGGIIDIELDPEHYNYALTAAIDRYRQRSTNAIQESFIFLDLQPATTVYSVPVEVQEITQVYRRGIGGNAGGPQIDPFSLAFSNNLYLINNPGGMSAGGSGTLATYDLAMQFQKEAGRMFGRDLLFQWDPVAHRITFDRSFTAVETVLMQAWNTRPASVLLTDVYSKPWLRDYATAVCKQIMGEARSKFSQIAGPQGGSTLNGEALKTEAAAEMERLDKEVMSGIDSRNGGYGIFIG
jgi:hypothetical protein